ncbi:uncharacterized protein LOC143537925 [Bidens hawaiensis]|uniref:uncharacterized protein LOC143537925 n=1 Tax=Bidens hawaiensis TaxID=980011 RepID=UPI00404A0D02
MSLFLIQGYSSSEEDNNNKQQPYLTSEEDEDEDEDEYEDPDSRDRTTTGNDFKTPLFDPPNPSASSSLPSALDAFSEISRPPQFLNNSVGESASANKDNDGQLWRHGHRKNRRDKNDIPEGAVVQAKAQLVGIRDRVSSEASNASSTEPRGSAKHVITATNPNAEDAADLLRMCVQCGIPKTFSNARGMVCPMCGDRPVKETDEQKKKGSMIKDKEKNKRMKGQSSHATWKSETEMQLRQQFD